MSPSVGEDIIRHRAGEQSGGRDAQGNQLVGPTTSATIAIKRFAPSVPDETAEAFGQEVTEAGTIYAFPGTDLRASDKVEIRGRLWQVHGQPQDWKSYSGSGNEGLVVLVRRVS